MVDSAGATRSPRQPGWRRWLPWPRRPAAGASVQVAVAAAPFGRLRLRLAVWYGGILAVALLLSGIGLYFGVREMLYRPIEATTLEQAQFVAADWQVRPGMPCPLPGLERPPGPAPRAALAVRSPIPIYFACFDANARLLRVSDLGSGGGQPPGEFLSRTLIETARRGGTASDTVEAGEGVGPVYRTTLRVAGPGSTGTLGFVQVGRSIAEQEDALRVLRDLLLLTGLLTLGVVSLGGLFMANRALVPARLAFSRQQDFIADAAHELRTPLTLLRANAEVLLRGRDRLTAEDAELLEDIVAEVQHMADLSADLLTLARLDAGEAALEHDVVDLGELASRLTRRFGPLAAERGLTLRADVGEKALVVADRGRIEEVGLILLDNAVKYTPPGGTITVQTSVEAGQEQARLVVVDDGPGISSEHLPRLGQRFYRVDKARSREQGGAGLGLAIARAIVEAHRGTLAIESAPGRGTTVRVSLPLAVAPDRRPSPAGAPPLPDPLGHDLSD